MGKSFIASSLDFICRLKNCEIVRAGIPSRTDHSDANASDGDLSCRVKSRFYGTNNLPDGGLSNTELPHHQRLALSKPKKKGRVPKGAPLWSGMFQSIRTGSELPTAPGAHGTECHLRHSRSGTLYCKSARPSARYTRCALHYKWPPWCSQSKSGSARQ
jgi:hypothetical protein